MAFDVSGLSAWANELSGKSDFILKPILGSTSMRYLPNKIYGIQGNNVLIPQIESTTPAQSGYGCGFTSSGTTTISQHTITTVPFTVQEQICLRDLHQYFTVQTIPGQSMPESWQMADLWLNRKLAQVAKRLGQAMWQGKQSYSNDSWLKLQNGFIADVDGGSGEITVTGGAAGTAITTSNVRTIFEEALFNSTTGLLAVPEIMDKAVAFCGRDTFATLRLKLMTDNLYHVAIGNADSADSAYSSWEMYYPGTAIKIIGIPELNSSNSVETGSLPAAVKNRILVTDPNNFVVGMNANNDGRDFRVWYSQDDDVLRFSMRGFFGTKVLFNDQVVTY